MQPFSTDAILSRLGLGAFDPEAAFLAAAAMARQDRLFCLPARVTEVLARRGAETPIVVLGRSYFGDQFMRALSARARILHVVDDYRAGRGEQHLGVDMISSGQLVQLAGRDPDIVAVNGCRVGMSRPYFDELCRANGIPCLNFEQAVRAFDLNATLDHRFGDWGDTIAAHPEAYLKLARRMADPYSVETLYALLTFHLTCNLEWLLNVARPYSTLYFRSGLFALGAHEKMVDCGASSGESTLALIGATRRRFGHSWMIEPDRINVGKLQALLGKHAGTDLAARLSLHAVAVGERAGEVPFEHLGHHGSAILPSASAPGCAPSEHVRVARIDDIVDDRPTIIKLDVEGFELPALKGAANTIREARPKIMASAYHRSTDLLDIPALVDTLAPGYRIGLRHHTEERWDTCLYFY